LANGVAFRITGLRKSFGPNEVLKGVNLALHAGEVTALMGANGAGKSTLVKIACGLYQADGGRMMLGEAEFRPGRPADAIRAGVVTVHQNIADCVVADLDVATNLTLDRLASGGAPALFNRRRMRREAQAVADRMGLKLDLKADVGGLPLADRQMVAIARAMAHEPKVLILDEPTSSLSSAEAERLFAVIDRLRMRGVAILYISHRMSDIRRLADRIVALRDGAVTAVFDTKPLDYEGAVNAMLGQQIALDTVAVRASAGQVLRAEDVVLAPGTRPFSMELGDGEIVAVTGLVGVGKTALAEVLFGARWPVSGRFALDGRPYAPRTPADAIRSGVFLIAKDRADSGIVPDFSLAENMSLPFLPRLSRLGVLARRAEQGLARDQITALGIVCRGEKDRMAALSGGNQQKVMVARWLAQPARLLLLDEPFQGVDIAARRDIARRLRQTARGRATLLFVTELDEAFETADRILVMSEHTIVGEHRNENIDTERLLAEIAGAHKRRESVVAARG
jgi:simple sugar transport system ATP-binding protein